MRLAWEMLYLPRAGHWSLVEHPAVHFRGVKKVEDEHISGEGDDEVRRVRWWLADA